MDKLVERIKSDGTVFPGEILKVDNFINHMVDPELMEEMGEDFYQHFHDKEVTKVLTAEVSGIAIATPVAKRFKVPMLFAKKSQSLTLGGNVYTSRIYSYTKEQHFNLRVSKDFLSADDKVLIIDDFLANGEALSGLVDLCQQAGAEVAGIGIAIEKSFQAGGEKFRQAGFDIYSQAVIVGFTDDQVIFAGEEDKD
ncbi:xanthine phosphoribosyltransferase [Aerococcus kribbianus]|uniref:Xanthine phosphoribosyltransferase n=1 Tax=Aerococcus kribbianus TaxID=2999064 RepID=A0A9X3JEA0_9LACT|nr:MULTISPECIES: xanthine phosphoribosyltransferase [unclassified Aerococcus]MCZ0716869.1 xanthine phosphoribosyltransferase [Aerococcus sp. YH-aer221]MCZ0725157.1 xanthine phosphoribosyltransferase [Aerococcus sp. YH-aer222]